MSEPRICLTCRGPILRRSERARFCCGTCKWNFYNAKARTAAAASS